jgi:hypothetical protein
MVYTVKYIAIKLNISSILSRPVAFSDNNTGLRCIISFKANHIDSGRSFVIRAIWFQRGEGTDNEPN